MKADHLFDSNFYSGDAWIILPVIIIAWTLCENIILIKPLKEDDRMVMTIKILGKVLQKKTLASTFRRTKSSL